MSTVRSAGVMPLMRAAWDRLAGLTRASFSRASARKWGTRPIIERRRNAAGHQPLLTVDLDLLPGDVAGILDIVGHLHGHLPRRGGQFRQAGRHFIPSHFRLPQRFGQRYGSTMRGFEQLRDPADVLFFRRQPLPTCRVHESEPLGQRDQPPVGIVGPQQQPVFGPAGKHAVRLVDAAGDQIVDHHADVRLVAAEHQRLLTAQTEHRVRAGKKPLRGRFFVPRGAVDLAGTKEPRYAFGLQRRPQLHRREIVVFDGIAIAEDFRSLQAGNQPQHGVLHIARQAGR